MHTIETLILCINPRQCMTPSDGFVGLQAQFAPVRTMTLHKFHPTIFLAQTLSLATVGQAVLVAIYFI